MAVATSVNGVQLEVTQIEGRVVFRRTDQPSETVEFTEDEWLQIVDSASRVSKLLELVDGR